MTLKTIEEFCAEKLSQPEPVSHKHIVATAKRLVEELACPAVIREFAVWRSKEVQESTLPGITAEHNPRSWALAAEWAYQYAAYQERCHHAKTIIPARDNRGFYYLKTTTERKRDS